MKWCLPSMLPTRKHSMMPVPNGCLDRRLCWRIYWIRVVDEFKGKAAGRAEGEKIGEARGKSVIILNMHKKGYALEQIMDVTDMSEAEIMAIIG